MARFLGALWLTLLLLHMTPAWALPPPKTPAELLLASDLVVDASCVSVVCVGKPYDDGTKIITSYRSTFYPSKSYKGGLPKSFTVVGESWQYKGSPPVGGWHQEPVPNGWIGKMYLKKAAAGGYTKVWWNALEEDKSYSNPLPLPACAATDGGPPAVDAGPPPADLMPAKEGGFICDLYYPEASLKPDTYYQGAEPPWPSGDDPAVPDQPVSSMDGGGPDMGQAGDDDSGCAVAPSRAPTWTLLVLLGLLLMRRRS